MDYRTDWTLVQCLFMNKSNNGRAVYSAYHTQGRDTFYAAVKRIDMTKKCNQITAHGLELDVMKAATDASYPFLAELWGSWVDARHLHIAMVCCSLFLMSHVFDIPLNPAVVSCISS